MGILDLGRYKGIVFAITGFLVFIAIILAVNHGKAGQFSDNVAGVKFLVQQQAQPRAVYDAGVDLAARLKSGQKIDETLETLRKAATSYDQALSGLAHGAHDHHQRRRRDRPAALCPPMKPKRRSPPTRKLWDGYKAKLDPVLRFSGSPYSSQPAAVARRRRGSFRSECN